MTHHFRYRIYDYEHQKPVATYLGEVTEDALKQDLKNKESYVRRYLEGLFRVNAEEYAREHPESALALLGGLHVNREFITRTGSWLPCRPPRAHKVRQVPVLGDPVYDHGGIRLWQVITLTKPKP